MVLGATRAERRSTPHVSHAYCETVQARPGSCCARLCTHLRGWARPSRNNHMLTEVASAHHPRPRVLRAPGVTPPLIVYSDASYHPLPDGGRNSEVAFIIHDPLAPEDTVYTSGMVPASHFQSNLSTSTSTALSPLPFGPCHHTGSSHRVDLSSTIPPLGSDLVAFAHGVRRASRSSRTLATLPHLSVESSRTCGWPAASRPTRRKSLHSPPPTAPT